MKMVARPRQVFGGARIRWRERLIGEWRQIEIAPAFALAARKAQFGEMREAALPAADQPRRLVRGGLLEGVEIGPRLGLHREIDDRAHWAASPVECSNVP